VKPVQLRSLFLVLPWLLLAACTTSEAPSQASSGGAAVEPAPLAVGQTEAPQGASTLRSDLKGEASPVASAVGAASAGSAPSDCPQGMARVAGGPFWVGTSGTRGLPDERPRYLTRVPNLCADRTEVTVAAYTRCVEAGQCTAEVRPRLTCNYGRYDRSEYPMNCLDWQQADTFCRARGARLPTEVEWEYLARGGAEYRKFSWGEDEPDGHTCWKRAFSCPVGAFPAGAFGLFDVTGNVWEWTSSDHGDYPWPPRESPHKVYRGGGWSRRFDKWLLSTLRNRDVPTEMGSHLGLRCVTLAPGSVCPYGPASGTPDMPATSPCLHGVDDVECPKGKAWNGVRCARPGEPECPSGTQVEPGHGCQAKRRLHTAPHVSQTEPGEHGDAPEVPSQKRTPNYDADCQRFQPERPTAFRLEGASHKDRNTFASARGCKNRDVGASWNSVCCP
jgi:formylglycine-generating enzyme required for sulfatase activity